MPRLTGYGSTNTGVRRDHGKADGNAHSFSFRNSNASRELRSRGNGMFFFFSNKVGCLGSLAVSVLLSLLLLKVCGGI